MWIRRQHFSFGNHRSNLFLIPEEKWCEMHNIQGFFLQASFFLWSYIHLKRKKQLKKRIQNDAMMVGVTTEFNKTKAAWNERCRKWDEKGRNLGTGQWFGIQWTEAKVVWTALCNIRENPVQKYHSSLLDKVWMLFGLCLMFKQTLTLNREDEGQDARNNPREQQQPQTR